MTLRALPGHGPARSRAVAVFAAGLCALLAGCAGGSGPGDAYKQLTRVDYGKPYIGMGKQEVPASGGAETLIYHYKGSGPVPGGMPKDATCTASLTFDGGTLTRVSYAHVNSRSPYAYQAEKDPKKAEALRRAEVPSCVFSLPRCPR